MRIGVYRTRRRQAAGKVTRGFLRDVEHLAEAAAETAEELHTSGLGHLARRLDAALMRLGGVARG